MGGPLRKIQRVAHEGEELLSNPDLVDVEMGGRVAVTSFFGPYNELVKAHAAMDVWFERNGVERNGPCWEVYVTDPGQVKNAEEWKTQVIYPIT